MSLRTFLFVYFYLSQAEPVDEWRSKTTKHSRKETQQVQANDGISLIKQETDFGGVNEGKPT